MAEMISKEQALEPKRVPRRLDQQPRHEPIRLPKEVYPSWSPCPPLDGLAVVRRPWRASARLKK